MTLRNEVQLITYADRLGGDLRALARLLRSEPFAGVFGGVHVLPFFTPYDGADAGFDPVDHTAVDPRLGSWDDVRDLAGDHDLVVDAIVNHVSADSAQFRDVVERGDASEHAPLFLTMSAVFPDGATEEQLTAIYRPRPGLPFTAQRLGERLRYVWTTFTSRQIDIDVRSDAGRAYLAAILDAVGEAGVKLLRTDAVGYAIKTPGTSCFMTPETFAFIDEFTALARERGMEVLVEVHSHYETQVEIASRVDLVYDFALPPLVLHALYSGDPGVLARWLDVRPRNALTVLDTHDGIGVVDVGPEQNPAPGGEPRPGLLDPAQVDELVEGIHRHSGGSSLLATGEAASNLDLYQVNCTFYDALGQDDARYLAARALQFFTPGVPQVYYVGALAGVNDVGLLQRTAVGRDINRSYYAGADDVVDLDTQLERPVVRALFDLARFRNTLPAFDGDVDVTTDGPRITLTRTGIARPEASATLTVDLATGATELTWTDGRTSGATSDLLVDPPRAG